MTDIRERITSVLRQHRFDDSMPGEVFCHEPDDSPMVGMKRGPDAQADWEEWVEHFADVLVAELGLTQETKHLADGMGGISTNSRTGETTVHSRPCTRMVRYVTAWKPAE